MSEQSGEQLNKIPEETAETYTLASILAEYKSEAFIRNERRLSKAELEKRADEIIAEMKRSVAAELSGTEDAPEAETEAPEAGVPAEAEQPEREPAEKQTQPVEKPSRSERKAARHRGKRGASENRVDESPAKQEAEPDERENLPEKAEEKPKQAEPAASPAESARETDRTERESTEEIPAKTVQRPGPRRVPKDAPTEPEPPAESTVRPVEDAEALREKQAAEEALRAKREAEEAEKRARKAAEAAARAEEKAARAEERAAQAEERRRIREENRARKREEAEARRAQEEEERRSRPELTPDEAQQQLASGIPSLKRRTMPAMVLSVLMSVLTVLAGAGFLPEPLRTGAVPYIILAVMQMLVMLLGVDVLAKGIMSLLAVRPGIETMILTANASALVDAVLKATGKNQTISLPYCAAAGLALAFALWGTGCRRAGYYHTIRSMKLASVPTVVTAEDDLTEDGTVLSKKLGSSAGFLKRCVLPDAAEKLYQAATPWYLALLVVLSIGAAYLSGSGAVLHCLACFSSAAATLTAVLVFGRPFSMIAKKLNGNGAALAGWAGAQDMLRAKGMIVRDLDVFPENTIILNGMKVLNGTLVEKVVAYTGSVVLATGSGLKRVFGELMRQYAAPLYHVEDFDCGTEGGVCAFIQREQVLVGSSAYMNLMGIRVPSSVEVAGAVYTAIDHELAGVFIVNYQPVETVQNSLYRLETGKLRPIFAIRDFNIHPSMLTQKFRLSEGSVVFLPVENRYDLSLERNSVNLPAALLSREGLWHYSETARGGRRLVRCVRRALTMTVLGSVLGVLICFISCARGAFGASAPGKLLVAMLLWAFATMMIADSAEGD